MRKIMLVASALLAPSLIAGCSDTLSEPIEPVFLRVDRTQYVALPEGPSFGGTPQVAFTLVARFTNASDRAVTFGRCGNATKPIYGIGLARPSASRQSAYDPAWGCPGSEPLALAPRTTRVDTIRVFGPTGRDGFTKAPVGELDGEFVLQYGTSAGTLRSQPFRVIRAID